MTNTYQKGNSKIAKNTLVVYIRMIIVVLVSLLTTRYVLLALGVSDFGLYNVVGGLIGMLNFISAAMSTTTSRFINYEMGKVDGGNPNKVFNICLVIHIAFAMVLILLAETLGFWYVNNILSVEPGKERDALFVFQMSTIIACVGLINVPYQSLLVAYEKFSLSATIDVLVTLIKLALVLVLVSYKGNSLMFYSISMCAVTFCSFILYHFIAYRKWPEVIRHKFYKDRQYYQEIFNFNNYNLLSTAAIVSRNQGSTLIINYFFGTIVNGSFSVARTVQSFVEQFTSNIAQAAGPQIIQSYSHNETGRSYYLVGKICRFSLLLYLLLAIPLFCEMEFVLTIWLKNVPDGSVVFCNCILLVCLIAATSSGLLQLINATGRVKWFKIQSAILYLICLPISIVLYKFDCQAHSILLLFVVADMLSRAFQLLLLRQQISFPVLSFIKEAYVRPFLIVSMGLLYYYLYSLITLNAIRLHVIGIFVSFLFSTVMILFIGLRRSERTVIMESIKRRIRKHERCV